MCVSPHKARRLAFAHKNNRMKFFIIPAAALLGAQVAASAQNNDRTPHDCCFCCVSNDQLTSCHHDCTTGNSDGFRCDQENGEMLIAMQCPKDDVLMLLEYETLMREEESISKSKRGAPTPHSSNQSKESSAQGVKYLRSS